jgi:hypothetical protein
MSTAASIALAVLLILGALAVYIAIPTRDAMDRAPCRSLYDKARTAADTATIDEMTPPRQRGRDQERRPATCGELRRLSPH